MRQSGTPLPGRVLAPTKYRPASRLSLLGGLQKGATAHSCSAHARGLWARSECKHNGAGVMILSIASRR